MLTILDNANKNKTTGKNVLDIFKIVEKAQHYGNVFFFNCDDHEN